MSSTSSSARDNAKKQRPRRAYIGNLRHRPDLPDRLHADLFAPHRLDVVGRRPPDGMRVSRAGGGNGGGGSAYALVEFRDVDYAIRVLDGVVFDGRTLRVARERTDLGAGGGGGGGFSFGSGRWAGGGGGDRHRVAGGARHRNDPSSSSSAAAAAEEEEEEEETAAATARSDGARAEKDDVGIYDRDRERGDEIVDLMRDVIAAEFEDGGGGGTDDAISTAIACTAAAVAVLSSMVALGQAGWGGEDDDGGGDDDGMRSERGGTNGSSVDSEIATGGDFRSRLQMPLSDLMEEYGDRDADWMRANRPRQQQPRRGPEDELRDPKGGDEDDLTSDDDFRSRLRMPLSKLLADYGERDDGWTRGGTERDGGSATGEQRGDDAAPTTSDGRRGMLAHYGKASVHLELASFGYKYGAPPHRSRDGFTYTRPLPPLDVRDLDRAPGHVSKFNGLSYLVRRSLLNPSGGGANDDHRRDDDDDDDCDDDIYDDDDDDGGGGATTTTTTTTTTMTKTKTKKDDKQRSPMRRRVDEIADEIIKVLVESIDEGGHGPVSPLTMTVSVGSEYGRHRSVVLVEHLAVVLRARLRRNDGSRFNDGAGTNGIVRQPVSVGTRHRDMDARHQDEEAFGEDLRREFRKAEKARTRQMRSAGWDDDGW